ncbi:MAG: phosphatidate cytidylyltransferase [Armatimonadetes bacterium]|nr:phosphatidate cytidylyltransferase [Armatimonadota bacterium]
MLPPRVVTGALYLVAWLVLCILGGWPLTIAVTALSWVAFYEFRWVASRRRVRLAVEVGYPVCLAFVLSAFYFANDPESHGLAIMSLILLALLGSFGLHLNTTSRTPTAAISMTVFGCMYCGLLPSVLVLLRNLEPDLTAAVGRWDAPLGFRLLAYLLAVTMISDVGGFVFGKLLGRHKMEGTVSPNKTYEGLVGVVLSAALASLLFGALLHIGPALRVGAADSYSTRAILHRFVLGAILGLAGQLGDMGASIFKREAEVKDYGGLFPGHGGVLDRIDSLIINAPILFLYAKRVL